MGDLKKIDVNAVNKKFAKMGKKKAQAVIDKGQSGKKPKRKK